MATQIQKRQIATTLIDGWTPADATWTYASASTITVPSGAASIYQKGDRIKWTQTTVKYGVIVAVADTLLTIAVNTDYTVANAAISANYFSHQANPLGYPGFFNWSPTVTFSGGTVPNTVSRSAAKYWLIGTMCTFTISQAYTNAGINNTQVDLTLPITGSSNYYGGFAWIGVTTVPKRTYISTTTMTSEFGAAASSEYTGGGSYPI